MKTAAPIVAAAWLGFVVSAFSDSTRAAAAPTFKVAFYNIQSGIGAEALRGHRSTFVRTINCDARKGALNAWGIGLVQRELEARIKNDPKVIALALAEAWNCASPDRVREALGWKAHSDARNGTTIVARYGFAGDVEWAQLDTSRNRNPKDTAWVGRGKVCLDAACGGQVDLYATHWAGAGSPNREAYRIQAQQTVDFMRRSPGPHLLVGDLNVFEAPSPVCNQRPNFDVLPTLRQAGYADSWTTLYGQREGFTGMVNRAGCGNPEGYVWKRIDYAWARGYQPTQMTRFGMAPPGDEAPSDHLGILAEYALR
jgi:hypothetical protein